jgi:uncharacterized membrane protein
MVMSFAALQNQSAAAAGIFVACTAFMIFSVFYLIARMWQFYFLIIDRDAGVFESIQLSWRITRGRAGTIFLVYIMQLALTVFGFLALCVGLIFTVPLSYMLLTVTYLAMLGPTKPPDRMPFTNWDDDLQVV